MELDAATVLEEAADLLLIHGRCTGVPVNDAGAMCVRGAIASAQGLHPSNVWGLIGGMGEASRALDRWLYAHSPLAADTIARWDRFGDAAGAAAGAAARAALNPTKVELQAAAHDLVARMIAASDD